MKRWNAQEYHAFLLIIFIELFILIALIAPFILHGSLNSQDMPGHLFSAYYTKEHLLPDIIGWNPFFYLGTPQNQFYPPLFTLLTVLLSFMFNIELAFKIVFSAAILLTPISFYYFARKLCFRQGKSAAIMLMMTAILFGTGEAYGGNFLSSFNAGIVGHALGIPILFFYLGSLQQGFKTKKIANSSVFMALLALSNLFAFAAGIIMSLLFIIFRINKENLTLYLKHATLSFLLAGFWIFPLLFKIQYSKTLYLPPLIRLNNILIGLILILAVLYSIFLIFKKKSRDLYYIAASLLALSAIVFIGLFFHVGFHFYRLQLIIFLLIPLLLANSIKNKISFVLIGLISVIIIFEAYPEIDTMGQGNIEIKDVGRLNGRTLILNDRSFGSESSFHAFQNRFVIETGNDAINGLFIQSSLNALILNDIVKIIDNKSMVVLNFQHPLYANLSDLSLNGRIPYYLNLFGINYIVSRDNKLKSRVIEKNIITFRNNTYNLYRVGNSSMIEVLNYAPVAVRENWDKKVVDWVFSEEYNKIFVDGDVPGYIGTGKEQIGEISKTKNYHKVRFEVKSEHPVPILVKVSYFPNWKAYANGKEIRVYKASPYLMLIYGNGEIELKYEKLLVDRLGYLFTLIGSLAIGCTFFSSFFHHKKRKK